jgi:catechol 2,3-dioxygenase-like lactoylglutathione lyase family enzyme
MRPGGGNRGAVIAGVHHLTLRVRDLAASAKFYEDALRIGVDGWATGAGSSWATPSSSYASRCRGRCPGPVQRGEDRVRPHRFQGRDADRIRGTVAAAPPHGRRGRRARARPAQRRGGADLSRPRQHPAGVLPPTFDRAEAASLDPITWNPTPRAPTWVSAHGQRDRRGLTELSPASETALTLERELKHPLEVRLGAT